MSVLVVGGGPTGLSLADALATDGVAVTIVEATSRWGGMAASIEVAGVRCDLGSHRLHPVGTERVEHLLVDLLGTDLQTRPRNGRIYLGGQWVRFPLRATDLVRHLPPSFTLGALRDTLTKPLRSIRPNHDGQPDTSSFAAVVCDGLGPTMLDWFYGPYAQKLWGLPADQLAGDLAQRRIANNSAGRIVAKLVKMARGDRPVFRYPRFGYGQVVDRLVDRLVAADVEMSTNTRIERLQPTDSQVVATDSSGRGRAFDRVFWTASPGHLADAYVAALPHSERTVPSYRPKHRAMVVAYLVYDGNRISQYDAHYLPGLDVLAARVSEPVNYRSDDDPTDLTVLCAEVVCDVHDDVWTAAPDDLGARIADDLKRIGLTDRRPSAIQCEYLPAVYPVFGNRDLQAQAELLEWAHGIDGVTVLGRQGLVVADNLHHVLDMALEAAACYQNGQWNAPRWSKALAHFETHIVED